MKDSAETDRPRASRARRLRRALLAVTLGSLGALGLAEVALRVSGQRERSIAESTNRTNRRWLELMSAGVFESVDDDVRRYAMRPGAEALVDDWTFRVTSHRTRGAEFPAEKPAGEKRMLCLGDSFAFGMWCDEDQSLVGQLARMANAGEAEAGSGIHWRAVNLGVPGYHSGQQLRSLEQDGLALDPDLVVVYYNANDISREGFFYDDERRAMHADHFPLPARLRRALWHSHLYGFVVSRMNKYWGSLDAGADPRTPWSPFREDNREYTRAALAEIARLCRERELPVFFVNQPLMTYAGDARGKDWHMLDAVEWAADVADELELPTVKLLGWQQGFADGVPRFQEDGSLAPPDFYPMEFFADEDVQRFVAAYREYQARIAAGEQASPPELVQPAEPDFHLTGAGYESMARVVYPAMRAAGLVP